MQRPISPTDHHPPSYPSVSEYEKLLRVFDGVQKDEEDACTALEETMEKLEESQNEVELLRAELRACKEARDTNSFVRKLRDENERLRAELEVYKLKEASEPDLGVPLASKIVHKLRAAEFRIAGVRKSIQAHVKAQVAVGVSPVSAGGSGAAAGGSGALAGVSRASAGGSGAAAGGSRASAGGSRASAGGSRAAAGGSRAAKMSSFSDLLDSDSLLARTPSFFDQLESVLCKRKALNAEDAAGAGKRNTGDAPPRRPAARRSPSPPSDSERGSRVECAQQ
jgi:hypothetical protein